MGDLTILYLTHNALDEEIATFCRRKLVEAAQELPIISVSQQPSTWDEHLPAGHWAELAVDLPAVGGRIESL